MKIRYVQVIMLFLGLVIAFTMRVNMSMAIVAMTDSDTNSTNTKGTFAWDMQTQSVVLSSFLWGYVIPQIPSGELAARYGGRILVTSCISINSIVTVIIPTAAKYGGWQALCGCRFLQGLSQGCLFPSVHNLVGKWVPLEEKGRLGTIIYGGCFLGTAMQLMVSGFIADSLGWPFIFYVNGAIGALWAICYIILGSDSPQKSKMITKEERAFIQNSLGQVGEQKKLKTPWCKIAKSCPFYSLLIAHCGHNWGFWTLIMEMPSYMNLVLGVDVKESGYMSALPYITLYILSFPFGFISDYALKKNWASTSTCRKVCNSIGTYGPATALIGLCFVPAGNISLAVGLLTIIVGLNAGTLCGYLLVHIDMAPNFSGTLMGITNTIANITGIVAPLVAGIILKDESDPKQWHLVFYLAAGIYTVANTLFVVFGSSKRQSWNEPVDAEATAARNKLEEQT